MRCPKCGGEIERIKVQDEGRTLQVYLHCHDCQNDIVLPAADTDRLVATDADSDLFPCF